jgi:hypothetical protein
MLYLLYIFYIIFLTYIPYSGPTNIRRIPTKVIRSGTSVITYNNIQLIT